MAIAGISNNPTFLNTKKSSEFWSSKLLNYVEPIEIGGFIKTTFFTEKNCNFNVGDRVFIVNGYYDSNEHVKKNKWGKYTDGWRVLGCDGCRVILDVDWTGNLPFSEIDVNDFLCVYNIRSQREFDWINHHIAANAEVEAKDPFTDASLFTFDQGLNNLYSGQILNNNIITFSGTGVPQNSITPFAYLLGRSIIWVPGNYNGSNDPVNRNTGISNGAGFYMRVFGTSDWLNITSYVITNRLRSVNDGMNWNGKLLIFNENFEQNGIKFTERTVYSFENSSWIPDISYKTALISKENFRSGKFGSGKHRDGIFGTYEKQNTFDGGEWTSGIFLNSNWLSGTINYKSKPNQESIIGSLGSTSSVAQVPDLTNNSGFGWNLFYDSNIEKSNILGGVFENCNIGGPTQTVSIDHFYGITQSYDIKGSFSKFVFCDLDTVNLSNSLLQNSNIKNSYFENTKVINSQVEKSVINNNSDWDDRSGITVNSSTIWSYWDNSVDQNLRGVLKLFISDSDFQKLKFGDVFYISKINKDFVLSSISDHSRVHLPIETKWILENYFNRNLPNVDDKILVSIKSKIENQFNHFAELHPTAPLKRLRIRGSIQSCSIDIDCSNFGIYRQIDNSSFVYSPNYLLGPINLDNVNKIFEGTQVNDAELSSGIFNNSNWLSGDHVNYQFNIISSITTNSPNLLRVRLNKSNLWSDSSDLSGKDLLVNDWIWLSPSIEKSTGETIGGNYKVIDIDDLILFRDIYLESRDGFTFSGTYSYGEGLNPNYISLHQTNIQNSTITSGFFRRSLLQSNTIVNNDFNNGDRITTSDNSSKLKLLNIYFRNTNNIVKNGIIYKSHFVNDTWESGILFNSVWKDGDFKDGLFKKGYWINGTFSNGFFFASSATQSTQFSLLSNYNYDTEPKYMNWNDGSFMTGEFYQSVWSKGLFSNGRFYYSDFYSGRFINGILGSKLILEDLTKFGYHTPLPISTTSSVFVNGIVENALVGGFGDVYWLDGRFEKGTFTSEPSGESIWEKGDFLGGKFSGVAKWLDGNFYGGKFLSSWAWNIISPPVPTSTKSFYAWQGGKFFGGEFGNGATGPNSTWYDGEFRGGIFRGRLWRGGIMDSGVFIGSGQSDIYSSPESTDGEQEWVNSFSDNFYGFWFDGFVVDDIQSWQSQNRVETPQRRKVDDKKIEKRVLMTNMLWRNGTFSHEGGTIQTSVWFRGNFMKGTFDSSIFNPYVDRTFQSPFNQPSFATSTQSIWFNGEFKSTLGTGSFYHSVWNGGNFRDGYMMGSIWKDGTWWYGKADNIYWENGRWKNGTWNGSPYDSTVLSDWTGTGSISMEDGRDKRSILNLSNYLGSDYIHMNNVFSASQNIQLLSDNSITSLTGSFTFSLYDIHTDVNGATGSSATWSFGTTFSNYNTGFITDSHVFTSGGDWGRFSRSTTPPSTKIWAWNGSTNKIFVDIDTNYQIDLRISVEETDSVEVEFGVGGLAPQRRTFNSDRQGSEIFNQVYEVSLSYRTTQDLIDTINPLGEDSGKQFYIQKLSPGILRILYINIYQYDLEYHPVWNNSLFMGVSSSNVILPDDPNLVTVAPSNRGDIVSLKFGNGRFKEGIWESGIWNDGWRSWEWWGSSDILACEGVIGIDGLTDIDTTYQNDNVSWLLKLKCLNDDGTSRFANLSILNVGDLVSVGNIIAIDVNERRRSITSPLRVVSIDSVRNILTLSYVTNFPVRRIVNDSPNHLVYVTKNIWLSGAFLNGYFKGVWNGGLVKGYPKVTKLESTQMIEGKFDGGHFKSEIQNVPFTNDRGFNTGLVQNFRFFDNNVGDVNDKKYLSWMDVNYYTQSRTNLNKDSVNFKIVPLANGTGSFFVNQRNIWGEPTVDVLKSISTFRDLDDQSTRNYSLGYNLTKYSNLLPDKGNFLKPFTTLYDQVGMSNFLNDPLDPSQPGLGWQINNYNSEPTISSNISVATTRKLNISNLNQILWTRYENINVTDGVLTNRYYMVEADVDFRTTEWLTYSLPPGYSFIGYQSPATSSLLGVNRTVPPVAPNDSVMDLGTRRLPFPLESLDPDAVWNTTLFEYTSPSSTISQYFDLDFSIEFPAFMNPLLTSLDTGNRTSISIYRSYNPYFLPGTTFSMAYRLPVYGINNQVTFTSQRIQNLTYSTNQRIWSGRIKTDSIGPSEFLNAQTNQWWYRPLEIGEKVWVELTVVLSSSALRQAAGLNSTQTYILNQNFNIFTFSGTFSNIVSGTLSVTQISGITASNILTFDNFDQETALASLYPGFTPSTTAGFNHLSYDSSKKIEYFFNKSNLEMTTFHSNQNADYYFGNISFWEVDMIPFFKYADSNQIDTSVQAPYYATAPRIDYNNANFDFIGNINLTIDVQNILINQVDQLPTGQVRPLDTYEPDTQRIYIGR